MWSNIVIGAFLVVANVTSRAYTMPTSPTIPDISTITSQPCGYPHYSGVEASPVLAAAASSPPSDADRTTLLFELQRHLSELKDQATSTIDSIKHWVSLMQFQPQYQNIVDYVSKKLRLPLVQYTGLSAEENSRLHVLLHLSHFAHFLMEQEHDDAYGDKQAQLASLKAEMMNSACILRSLLPGLDNAQVKDYAVKALDDKRISLQGERSAVKRTVTFAVVDTMRQILATIQVSVDARSVIMT